jgi:hypothetical protein
VLTAAPVRFAPSGKRVCRRRFFGMSSEAVCGKSWREQQMRAQVRGGVLV